MVTHEWNAVPCFMKANWWRYTSNVALINIGRSRELAQNRRRSLLMKKQQLRPLKVAGFWRRSVYRWRRSRERPRSKGDQTRRRRRWWLCCMYFILLTAWLNLQKAFAAIGKRMRTLCRSHGVSETNHGSSRKDSTRSFGIERGAATLRCTGRLPWWIARGSGCAPVSCRHPR